MWLTTPIRFSGRAPRQAEQVDLFQSHCSRHCRHRGQRDPPQSKRHNGTKSQPKHTRACPRGIDDKSNRIQPLTFLVDGGCIVLFNKEKAVLAEDWGNDDDGKLNRFNEVALQRGINMTTLEEGSW